MSAKNRFEFENLFLSTEFSDYTYKFISADGKQYNIPLHLRIIESRSAYFSRPHPHKKNKKKFVREYPVTFDMFKEYLQMFYLNDIKIQTWNLIGICYLIREFESPSFWPIVEQFMRESVDLNRFLFLQYLDITLRFDELKSLRESFSGEFTANTVHVLQNSFEKGEDRLLLKMLQLYRLDISDESELMHALIRYGINTLAYQKLLFLKSSLIEVIDIYLPFVRFPRMKLADIMGFQSSLGLLSPQEYNDLIHYVRDDVPLPETSRFCVHPRTGYMYKLAYCFKWWAYGNTCVLKLNYARDKKFKGRFKVSVAKGKEVDKAIPVYGTIIIDGEEYESDAVIERGKRTALLEWTESVEFNNAEIDVRTGRCIAKIFGKSTYWGKHDIPKCKRLPPGLTVTRESESFIEYLHVMPDDA